MGPPAANESHLDAAVGGFRICRVDPAAGARIIGAIPQRFNAPMNLDRVPAGKDIPNDCNVIIEIPMRGDPIKYEVDKETGAVFVDRFMSTAMHYPCNYGYIPRTLSDDGDPCDVLVLSPCRSSRASSSAAGRSAC